MTKNELLDYAKKTAAAPSCYAGLKTVIADWEKAVGTAGEHAAAEKMIAGLKECVGSIDSFIALAKSPKGAEILGGKEAAAGAAQAAEAAKAKGTKYCICDACTNGGVLLDHAAELLA